MTYQVNFRSDANNYEYLNGEYELSEVIEYCKDLEVDADLWSLSGFRAGWVKSDGSYAIK